MDKLELWLIWLNAIVKRVQLTTGDKRSLRQMGPCQGEGMPVKDRGNYI